MTETDDTRAARPGPAAALKKAYLAIERLERRLAEQKRAVTEPIAIVGAGCRFPGGVDDLDSYWAVLTGGIDAITEVPAGRWDSDAFAAERPRQPGRIAARWGGFVDGVEDFDHDFFGISLREARDLDPQQRLALEVAWEALEHAGQSPDRLAGQDVGVYFGVCGNDYATRLFSDPARITAHASTGTAHSVLPGRISYLLDLRGPSVAVDTACSSSLVAVHQACQSLRLGECDLALAGGVNVLLEPHTSIAFSQFPDMLSVDGRCKTFDAAANGYVRGEGAGAVVLKRLSDALAGNDPILAVLRGSAVNQDGRSSGVTAPNGTAQREVLRRALTAAAVDPRDVGYVEAHGTGTSLGDPIEVEALAEVYGRPDGPPMYLGSAKTNIGHLEGAAGIAGLLKTALCASRGAVPGNLHFTALNPHIDLAGTSFTVPTSTQEWDTCGGPRVAAVSSFGFSGTNAHVLVEQPPERAVPEGEDSRPGSVLALSARTGSALTTLARRYRDRLAADDDATVADVCFSAATGRSHGRHRLAVVGTTREEVATRLGALLDAAPEGPVGPEPRRSGPPEVAFVFTGQGSLYPGMGHELYRTEPTFRAAVDECDAVLRAACGASLLPVLLTDDRTTVVSQEIAQPALFAVEYGLARLWESWGVLPSAVLGHSLGEYTAACVAGVLTVGDAVRLVAERGRLLADLPESGEMAAILAPVDRVAELVAGTGADRISIAAINAEANTAVSGESGAVAAVREAAHAAGWETQALRVDTPFHSPLVEPVLDELRTVLRSVRFGTPRVPFVSGLTGEEWPWDRAVDAEHWVRHTREPVRFADGVAALRRLGCTAFVEAGPTSTLLGLVAQNLGPEDTGSALLLPSLRSSRPDWEVLLDSVARLYAAGGDVDWAGFDRGRPRTAVRVPLSVFERVRCWRESGTAAPDGPHDEVAETGAVPEERAEDRTTASRNGDAPRPHVLPSAEEVLARPPGDRVRSLADDLVHSIAARLGSADPTRISHDEPLAGLGLDSLMAVELKNEIQAALGVVLSVASVLKGATVTDLAEQIVWRLAATTGPGAGSTPERPEEIRRVERGADALAEQLLQQIDELSEEQVRAMTLREQQT